MMSLLRFAYVIALRRAITGWRLEAVLFGGIVLAVALMASGDIFSNLLADAALRHALKEAPPKDANFWVRSFSSRDDPVAVDGRREAFRARSGLRSTKRCRPHGALPDGAVPVYRNGHPLLPRPPPIGVGQ